MTPPLVPGIAELADRYDAFIVDLWGVVHGGRSPYPGVVEALERLQAMGKAVALLSNAPRRAHLVEDKLGEIGVPRRCYDALLTSGEAAHEALLRRDDADHAALGRRVLFIAPSWDSSLLANLDYERTEDVDQSDFLLVVGFYDETRPVSDYDELFARARGRDLPLICANPDLVVQRQDGTESPCAGLLAKVYAETGGRVIHHGKPDPAIFHRCLARLGVDGDSRTLVVGDSLTTDIPGARAAGMDALWVTRGIHAGELGISPGESPEPARMHELLARYGQRPQAVTASFRW